MHESVTECRKLFVLDTNVILHDGSCLDRFDEHDIAIPITVLEELDQFKRGNQDINFQAREFLRRLDDLTGDVLADEGARLGDGRGAVRVVFFGGGDERLKSVFLKDAPDHRILASALSLKETNPDRPVILITKDTNLRMKAKSLGVPSQDYTTDKIDSFDNLYTGKRVVDGLPSESIESLYVPDGDAAPENFPQIDSPVANENFVLRNGSKSALARYRATERQFQRIEKFTAYGITPRNAEQSFALNALIDNNISLVTLAGRAGTGKTLLALAAALHRRADYRQIMLARPIVPLSNRDIGYLPGDISAKLDPYMQPLFDNLTVIRHQFDDDSAPAQRIAKLLATEKLVISPLAYIRGRSLQRIYFIVDEAQNLTPHEVKTIITRAGAGTKIIFTGDVHQIDHPYLDSLSNGLSYLINRMVGQSLYAHVTLEKGERSTLADLASNLL